MKKRAPPKQDNQNQVIRTTPTRSMIIMIRIMIGTIDDCRFRVILLVLQLSVSVTRRLSVLGIV